MIWVILVDVWRAFLCYRLLTGIMPYTPGIHWLVTSLYMALGVGLFWFLSLCTSNLFLNVPHPHTVHDLEKPVYLRSYPPDVPFCSPS